jgi:hypothetical protein
VTTTASASGTFQISIAVPLGTATGTYTILAQDAFGHSASAPLTVTATTAVSTGNGTLTLSASSGMPGALLRVSGSGFRAGERNNVSLAQSRRRLVALGGTTKTYTAASDGTFHGSYRIPQMSSGQYMLVAVGRASRTRASTNLTIQRAHTRASWFNQHDGGVGQSQGR